jgi:hypothetical protein
MASLLPSGNARYIDALDLQCSLLFTNKAIKRIRTAGFIKDTAALSARDRYVSLREPGSGKLATSLLNFPSASAIPSSRILSIPLFAIIAFVKKANIRK